LNYSDNMVIELEIKKPSNPKSVQRPGYYPTLEKMTPQQRWIYYEWRNGNIKDVYIDYVFVYLWEIEKQIAEKKIDKVILELKTLIKKYGDNISFRCYAMWDLFIAIESLIISNELEKAKNEIKKALNDLNNTLSDDQFPSDISHLLSDLVLIYEIQKKEKDAVKVIEKYYKPNPASCINTGVLSIKARIGMPISGEELLLLSKGMPGLKSPLNEDEIVKFKRLFSYNHTVFTPKKFDEIAKKCEEKLKEFQKERGIELLKYVVKKHENEKILRPEYVEVHFPFILKPPLINSPYIERLKEFLFHNMMDLIYFAKRVAFDAENEVRKELKIPPIGEGWVSESVLFHTVKELFPEKHVYHHAHETWLGRQHLDIYIPEFRVAIEYQGQQHFTPVDFFGGIEGFKKIVDLDKKKRDLCKKNNVALIEVAFNDEYSKDGLKKKIIETSKSLKN